MNIDSTSADIASMYIETEIVNLCDDLFRHLVEDDDVVVYFRYAMALCDVLRELDATKGKEQEELIISAQSEYPEEILDEIDMPSWI